MDFILNSIQRGYQLFTVDSILVHAFTPNNKSALRPGAQEQIEAQLVNGLQQHHFAVADQSVSHAPSN